MVGAHGASGNDGVVIVGQHVGHREFQLADLVAAVGLSGQVVPFQIQPAAVDIQTLLELPHTLDGGREVP